MTNARGWTTALALVGVLLAAPVAGMAQVRGGPPGGPPGQQREDLERRLQARFGQIVARQLGLAAEQERALSTALRASDEARRELMLRERELRVRIAEGVSLVPRGEPTPLLSSEEAREVLRRMRALREEELRLRNAEEARLLEVLSPAQLVRFYAVRELLSQRVRRLEQGPRTRPGGGGERGDGGPFGPLPRR